MMNEKKTRICRICNQEFELTTVFFRPSGKNKNRFRGECRKCESITKKMNRRKCSIEGCDAPHERHGFCAKHAQRFMRYGDPLFVTEKEIAVDKMRQSLARNHPANPNTYKKFYGKHIHRIVAEEKIGRCLLPGEIVHHVDGDKHNNSPSNIEIMTQSEHIRLYVPRKAHAK